MWQDVLELAKDISVDGMYLNLVCAQGRASELRDQMCLSKEQQDLLWQKVQEIRKQCVENAKLLEFKQAERASVFISAQGDYVSQGWATEDCISLGNVFTDNVQDMWRKSKIDHAVHLMQYLQHPLIYK